MPTYEVEDANGQVLELEGDHEPTAEELKGIFAQAFAPPAHEKTPNPYTVGWGYNGGKGLDMGNPADAFQPFPAAKRLIDKLIPEPSPETEEMQAIGMKHKPSTSETVALKAKGALEAVASPGGVVMGVAAPMAPALVGAMGGVMVAPQAIEGVKELSRGEIAAGATDLALAGSVLLPAATGVFREVAGTRPTPRPAPTIIPLERRLAGIGRRMPEQQEGPIGPEARGVAQESHQLPAPRARMPEFTESTLEPEGPPRRALPAPGEAEGEVLLPESPLAPRTEGYRVSLPVEPEAAAKTREVWSKPIDVEAQVTGVDALRQLASIEDEIKRPGKPYQPASVNVDLRQLERMMQRNSVSRVESWADETIQGKMREAGSNPYFDPEFLAAAATKGAILFKRGVTSFAEWADAMRKQFGPGIEERLRPIYDQTSRFYAERETQTKSGEPQEGVENASQISQATTLHGDVLRNAQEGKGPGEVPVNEGEPGVRAQAQEVTPLSLALDAQREAGWNTKWPFIPADLMNADFREAIRNDPSLSSAEKSRIFSSGEKIGVVPKGETALPQPTSGGEEVPKAAAPLEEPRAAGGVEPAAPSIPLGVTNPKVQAVMDTMSNKLWKAREGFRQMWESRPNSKEITQGLDGADTLAHEEGRQVFNSLRLEGTPAEREAAFAIVEANHDYHKLGVFVNQARGKDLRAERAARLAMTDYARLEPLARKVESILDAQIGMEHQSGINTEQREAYVPHIIDTDLLLGTKRPIVLAGRGGGLASGFKKGRVFDTIYDAIEAGYKPKSMDVAQVVEHRVRAGQTLINRMAWAESMNTMVDPIDHQPVVTKLVHRDYGGARPPEYVAPMGYETREIVPGIRVAVHEGYTSLIDSLTGKSVLQNWAPTRILLQTEGTLKHGLLLFDTFHASRILQKELFLTSGKGGYRKGLSLLEYSDGDLAKAIAANEITPEMAAYARGNRATADLLMKSGLNVGRIQENLYADTVRNLPFFGTFNKWVFDKVTRGAMLESGVIEMERMKRANAALSDKEVALEVSRRLNALFGNLGRQGVFNSASFRDAARLIFLAPQWVESMVRTEAGSVAGAVKSAAQGRSPIEGPLARSTAKGLLAYFIGTQLINLATRGKPTWENEEKGHKLDAWIPDITGKTPGYFLSPLSVVAEVTHDAIRLMHAEHSVAKAGARFIGNKLSPLMRAEEVLRTGKDYKGETMASDWDRVKAAGVALAPTPIPLSPLTRKDNAGQIQRQLTASLGVKTENAPSADQQIHEMAREWMRKNEDPKLRAQWEQREKEGFVSSDYTPLRKALRTGDTKMAKEEYGKLLGDHTPKQIYEALKPRPVTGSRGKEARFRSSLSKSEDKLYDKALEERQSLFERFLDLEKP